jgi:hypothetical protein
MKSVGSIGYRLSAIFTSDTHASPPHNAAMKTASFALSAIGYRLSAIFTSGGAMSSLSRHDDRPNIRG